MQAIARKTTRAIWQQELAQAIKSLPELLDILSLQPSDFRWALDHKPVFPLRVPLSFVGKMQPNNPHDPLLLQVLPQMQETNILPGYSADPLEETDTMPVPGLLHKYKGRVLLTLIGACAVNCRYCFRRHYPYSERIPKQDFTAALEYISKDKTIQEVILSGGDPLLLKDSSLAKLFSELEKIEHVQILRIHTRTPVVLPSRIDGSFVALMRSVPRLKKVMVLHCNHPREVDAVLASALQPLLQAGVTLFNQSVLLRGVNAAVDVLAQLSERLFKAGVLPYYLHQMDKVAGAGHFNVPVGEARKIYAALQAELPGYLCPRWVVETPGAANKQQC